MKIFFHARILILDSSMLEIEKKVKIYQDLLKIKGREA